MEVSDTAAHTAVLIDDEASALLSEELARQTDAFAPHDGTAKIGPGTPLGRYVVDAQIGVGGMGVVFRANDPKLDRQVAIKVLHAGTRRTKTTEGRARLIREAQAMAKLSHDHVVSVFDVGIADGRVFVAMELLSGVTLDVWLTLADRSPEEILAVAAQAGRGLAAAHAGGFAHRDFKPSNVMVTDRGRAVVMDFGLARGLDGEASSTDFTASASADAKASAHTGATASPDVLTSPLTRAGVIMGTPAYMAPEQHLGKVPDARADQFSFCATVWEALQGKRAFAANSMKELAAQKIQQGPQVVADHPIAERVAVVLRRGLLPEPAQRFATMDSLLAALDRANKPRVSGTAALGVAAVAVGAGLFSWVAIRPAAQLDPCAQADARVAALWNDERRTAIHEAFVATGVAYADDAWTSTERRLGQYAEQWQTAHREHCDADAASEERSAVFDLRMACLSRAEAALAATLRRLEHADATVVERATGQAATLPALARCADDAVLLAQVAPPEDPAVAAQVEALRADLVAIAAEEKAGHFAVALPRAESALAEARALGYAPLTAEAQIRLGSAQFALGHHEAAATSWSAAAWLAAGVGADVAAADAATRLVHLFAEEKADPEGALAWARHARAWLGRGAPDALAEARLESNIGIVHSTRGRAVKAEEHFRRAYDAKRELLGDDHPEVAGALENLGLALAGQGRLAEAVAVHRRAAEVTEATLGKAHPDLGLSLSNLAATLDESGQHDEALTLHRRALAIHEAALGPEHPAVARDLDAMGGTLSAQARFAEARPLHERSLQISRAHFGDNHPEVAWAWGNLGLVSVDLHDYEAALGHYDKAMSIMLEVFGEEHEAVGATHSNRSVPLLELGRLEEARAEADTGLSMQLALLGRDHPATAAAFNAVAVVLFHQGDKEGALARHLEALSIVEATLGSDHPEVAATLLDVAAVEGELGRPADALSHVSRAISILDANPVSPAFVAAALFIKAQAQWDSGGDAAEARALAERAEALYREHHDAFAEETAEIRAWLAAHGPA